MTVDPTQVPLSAERVRRRASRVLLGVITALIVTGLALAFAKQTAESTRVLGAGVALLIAIPASGVVAVLIDRVRHRDWSFALAALVVILLIGYSVVTKVW